MRESAQDRQWMVADELDSSDAYRAFIATSIFRTIQDAQAINAGDVKYLSPDAKDPSHCRQVRILLEAHGGIAAWINSKDFHRWCQATGRDGDIAAQFIHDLMFGQGCAADVGEDVLRRLGNNVSEHRRWHQKKRQIKEPLRLMKLFQPQ